METSAELLTDEFHNGVDELVEGVVSACQPRLLGRLRSRHAKSSSKHKDRLRPPILPKLQDAVRILRGIRGQEGKAQKLNFHAESLSTSFAELEDLHVAAAKSAAGSRKLIKIVNDIEDMMRSVDLKSIFGPIPYNISEWSGESRNFLIEALMRIAQYPVAARYLVQSARKVPACRRFEIKQVSPVLVKQSVRAADLPSPAVGYLTRAQGKKKETKSKSNIARLGANVTKIQQHVVTYSQQKKRIHAEIQLIFHFEQADHGGPRPRIICSNKHACFLCDLFIKAHGHFYVPGTHGTLYPRWRIPTVDEVNMPERSRLEFLQCLERFNAALEHKLVECLTRPKARLPDINESTLFLPRSTTPSIISAARSSRAPEAETLLNNIGNDAAVSTRSSSHVELREPHLSLNHNGVSQRSSGDLAHYWSTHDRHDTITLISHSATPPQSSSRAAPISPVFSKEDNPPPNQPTTAHDHVGISDTNTTQPITLTLNLPVLFNLTPRMQVLIRTPTVTLHLSNNDMDFSTQTMLRVSMEWLALDEHSPQDTLHSAVDLSGLSTERDTIMPVGILFTETGLQVREKNTILIVRAIRPK